MWLTQLVHAGQAAFSAYSLYISYVCITNLRQYEQQSEKAAEWSDAAAQQLHKTRTTMTSGALAVLTSLTTSSLLAITPHSLPVPARYIANTALLLVCLFTRAHVSNFWTSKAKVPLVGGWNAAVGKSKELVGCLHWLEWSWVGSLAAAALVGY